MRFLSTAALCSALLVTGAAAAQEAPPPAPTAAPAQAQAAEAQAAKSGDAAKAAKAAASGAVKASSEGENERARAAASPEVFEQGLGDFYDKDYADAAAKMYDYVATNEDTVDNYEWAEYFLAISLKQLGFSHGALEYLFNVATNRTRPEILPDALAAMEDIQRGPHDEHLLQDRLLVDNEFGYLPPRTSDFVRYEQGLGDLRDERVVWAERLFDKIQPDSPYKPKAMYAMAVERLRGGRNTDAVALFRAALKHPEATVELRNECRLALARVLYEAEHYDAARRVYEHVEVPELSTAEASLYLEKAWASYWLRDYRRTVGILYALEAPSYQEYFSPEKYILRALVYKNLCHYIPAKRALRRFKFRYGATLENIRERIDLRDDEVLRTAALSRGSIGRLAAFRRLLRDENDRIDTVGGDWVEVGLDEQLRKIYALKSEQIDLQLDAELAAATREVAAELVDYEEQSNLLDYEIGLAIYRRLKKEQARRPTEDDSLEIPSGGDAVYYRFAGEFWNDELPDYQFFIENRCFDEGGED